jgi:predicted lipid-binding transport protein (Tim44 family)
MKKMFIAMMLVLASTAVVVADVQAKRLGGGSSLGRQSTTAGKAPAGPMQQQQATRQATPPAAAPGAAAAKPASPWRGLLGGALLGLGLGALLSHFGMGGALASMIGTILTFALIAGAVFFLYRYFTRNKSGAQPTPAYAGGYGAQSSTPEIGSGLEQSARPAALQGETSASGSSNPAQGAVAYGVPADFDIPAFLRHAKTYFIRLQAAWDKGDVKDLAEFTTPEMYAELKLQIQERGAAENVTDVVSVNAELLGIEEQGTDYLASVRFEGLIRESAQSNTAPFTEIWNLQKPINGQGGWMLAGVQQVSQEPETLH